MARDAKHLDLEKLELGVLFEAIYRHYGYNFRNYAYASTRRRVNKHIKEKNTPQWRFRYRTDARVCSRARYATSSIDLINVDEVIWCDQIGPYLWDKFHTR